MAMAALETFSFQDLLRALALKYEQARSLNVEIVREKAQPVQSSVPPAKHQEQIIWQDWEVSRGDTQDSVTDPFCNQPKPIIDSITAVHVSKTSPASSWQKADYSTIKGRMIGTPLNSLKSQKLSPSGRHDGCRVAPPVLALQAPPQDTLEIGMDDVDQPESYGMSKKYSEATQGELMSSRMSSRPTSRPTGVVIEFDNSTLATPREKEEKRIRRQFKRLTNKGSKRGEMRRLFPQQLHQVVLEMKSERENSGLSGESASAGPTETQVIDALREFVTTVYSSERVDRMLAGRPSSNPPQQGSDICLDLPTFFDLIMEQHENSLSEECIEVLSCVRAACLEESRLNNDEDSADSSGHGQGQLDVLRTSDNRLDTISASVILLNAVVIGVSTDIDSENVFWEVLEIMFTLYFTSEMCYKMKIQGCRGFFLGADWHWNNFDAIVVFIAIFDLSFTNILRMTSEGDGDTGNLQSFTIIKMARLGRLARLVRLLKFKLFHELKLMIQGVIAGLRVLLWAVVLLFFFIYLLGIVLRKTMGESEIHHYAITHSFESVHRSMFTLFRCFTDGCTAYDGTPLQVHLFDYYGSGFMFAYMLTSLFVTMGIFNLIMAIFIDNVMEASVHRKQQERGANAATMEVNLKELIAELVSKSHKRRRSDFLSQANLAISKVEARFSHILDLDDPQSSLIARKTVVDRDIAAMNAEKVTIDRATFESWLAEPDFLAMLEELDIGTSNKSELFDVLDCDLSGELEVSEVISGLMKLRGPSDKSDAVAALLGIRYMTSRLDEVYRTICEVEEP